MNIENLDKYVDNYQQFLKLNSDIEMKMLWHSGYWDGPLSGLCLLKDKRDIEPNNQKYWFSYAEAWIDNNSYPEDDDDFEPPWWRRFIIIKPTNNQLADVEARHAKFQRMVGTHCDYNDEGKRSNFHYNDTVTKESLKQYYKESKSEITPSVMINDDQIIGWIELKLR